MSGANAPRLVGAGPQRRVLFGLLDAAGWGWAGVRAVAWTLVIILLLGYIPDRAYYLVVSPTVDLGLNLAPIVNIDRKSTRLNSNHVSESRMPSSA